MIPLAPARRPLRGDVVLPGDKSIGHRAVIAAALARGRSTISGLSSGEDNHRTVQIFRDLGVVIAAESSASAPTPLIVDGVGLRGLSRPSATLNCGNSGTTARLLSGLLAAQPFASTLDGDASLRTRPMRRVIDPLTAMGAGFRASPGDRLPMYITGAKLSGIDYALPVPSAQVKSALLLAGLYASGPTIVRESAPTRDHTERLLRALGVPLSSQGGVITVSPAQADFGPRDVTIPGDPSSAALIAGAALIVPGSECRLHHVCLNETRTGFIDVWRAMGANIAIENPSERDGEPCGDLIVRASALTATTIAGDLTVRAIDEIPIIAVTAAFASGVTTIRDARELRVKESDRLSAMTELLRAFGVAVEERNDGLVIEGGANLRAASATTHGDHRIAMCAAILALSADGDSSVDETASIATSFPSFFTILSDLQR